jgi:hypothetical protein
MNRAKIRVAIGAESEQNIAAVQAKFCLVRVSNSDRNRLDRFVQAAGTFCAEIGGMHADKNSPTPAQPERKENNGNGVVWLVVGGAILVMGVLLSWNSWHGSGLDQPVPVQARTAPEPKPVSKPVVLATPKAAASAEVVAKPTFKLQAVFYSAKQPSAMINGRTVFVHDALGEFHVASIATNSVTLASPSETKVLKLGQ